MMLLSNILINGHLTSVQDWLQFAQFYNTDHIVITLCCKKNEENKHGSSLHSLKQLEREELINLELVDDEGSPDMYKVNQLSLTVKGHQILSDIKNKSVLGIAKNVLVNAVTAIVTTLTWSSFLAQPS